MSNTDKNNEKGLRSSEKPDVTPKSPGFTSVAASVGSRTAHASRDDKTGSSKGDSAAATHDSKTSSAKTEPAKSGEAASVSSPGRSAGATPQPASTAPKVTATAQPMAGSQEQNSKGRPEAGSAQPENSGKLSLGGDNAASPAQSGASAVEAAYKKYSTEKLDLKSDSDKPSSAGAQKEDAQAASSPRNQLEEAQKAAMAAGFEIKTSDAPGAGEGVKNEAAKPGESGKPAEGPEGAAKPTAGVCAMPAGMQLTKKSDEEGEGIPGAPALTPQEMAILRRQSTMTPEPSDVDYDPPLVKCFAMLFKLHGKPISTKLLMAGLPKSDGTALHPSAVIRAAKSAGLRANIVFRQKLSQISTLTLPCILMLHGNNACVLTHMTDTEATVILPEGDIAETKISREALEEEYVGYAIFAKPEAKLDKRASEIKLLKHKKWFWGTLFHFMPIYKHVFGASVVVNLLALGGPLFFMNVYDRVVPNNATDTLWVLAIGIGIAYIFDFLLRNLRSYFVDVAGRNADIVLASRLMQQVLSMRLDVKPDSTGSLANNLREFESLRDFFGSTTLMALVDLPFLIIFILIIAFIGGSIVVVPLTAVPLVVCIGLFMQFPLQQVTEKGFKENMQKNALLVEIINGLETIKTSMAEGRIQHAWERVVGMSASSNSHSKRMANLSITLTIVITQLVSVFIIIWGVYKIGDGSLSQGGLIACNMLAGRAMAPLSQIASMLNRLQQSRMALKSLDLLMSLETEQPESGQYVDFGHLEHSLTLEDVCFKYPGSERFALENVNLFIRAGEKVGIIGRMGSGKSTFGRLCVGLFQPAEGAVKLGGVDIRQLDMVDLRSRVGYVSQDNYLFYGTVRENISFGNVNVDDRMVLRAANIAGVTDFIRAHPAGFGMPVGERGMSLSGGQRQSVAIARALLNDPDILIMDEPSSNMDNSSELALKQRLAASLGNKTLLLITHRLSMLDLVDRLIVMDSGRVVADGPKNAVLNALRNQQMKANAPQQVGGQPNQPVPGGIGPVGMAPGGMPPGGMPPGMQAQGRPGAPQGSPQGAPQGASQGAPQGGTPAQGQSMPGMPPGMPQGMQMRPSSQPGPQSQAMPSAAPAQPGSAPASSPAARVSGAATGTPAPQSPGGSTQPKAATAAPQPGTNVKTA